MKPQVFSAALFLPRKHRTVFLLLRVNPWRAFKTSSKNILLTPFHHCEADFSLGVTIYIIM
ncbi:hypothetical protein ASF92_08525 [Pedobacter sp. Leaf176]|nr:hypothetical protein ASF92_08525 [Pedobacter sp. Leaf176]